MLFCTMTDCSVKEPAPLFSDFISVKEFENVPSNLGHSLFLSKSGDLRRI